jgi:hypothetical protein
MIISSNMLQVDHKSLIQKWIHVEFENSALFSLILDLISPVLFVVHDLFFDLNNFLLILFDFLDEVISSFSDLQFSEFLFLSFLQRISFLFLSFEVSHIVISFSVFLSHVWFVGGSEFVLVSLKGTALSHFDQLQTISLFVIWWQPNA